MRTFASFVTLLPRVCRPVATTADTPELPASTLDPAWQVLDRAPMEILCIDKDLRITRANRFALAAAGSERSLLGLSLDKLAPELITHPVITALQADTSVDETTDLSGSLRLHTGQDGRRLALWYRTPAAVRPSTADRDCSAERVRTSESANRLKKEFIANINHEVRTPMNAIIGYTEMLAEAGLAPREQHFLDVIHKNSLTLVTIFNDIMELSMIESGRLQIQPSPVPLQSIVDEIAALCSAQAVAKGLQFRTSLAPDLPRVFVLDGLRVRQSLQSLVANAIRYTARGTVQVTVDGAPSVGTAGCFDLRFRVEDSGIGIPAEEREKLFELFQRDAAHTVQKYNGVDLRLTLCSRLVALMGGLIALTSREGEGTRFTITFPAVQVAEPLSGRVEPASALPQALDRPARILVVDDMAIIRDVFVNFFRHSPVEIRTADSGEAALRLAAETRPDLVFMDLNLPGLDGCQVTAMLRRDPATTTVPVVVMTGDLLTEDEYRPPFDGLLQKPFGLEAIQWTVDRFLRVKAAGPARPGEDSMDPKNSQAERLRAAWTGQLEALRCEASRCGSLSSAMALGQALQSHGRAGNEPTLARLGTELVLHADRPDIVGVERLLAQLERIPT